MSTNESLGPYRIGERVGNAVWIAEDERTGRRVALKLLTKQLPKDQAKRDALVRDARLSAIGMGHAFIVPVIDVAAINDYLVMTMEVVDGKTLSKHLGGRIVERAELLDITYQIAEGLRYFHAKGLLHGNISGDSVLVTSQGQVKIGGLNLANLLPRREGGPTAYQQKGNDARAVAYMAPEQIMAQQVDAKADIFSLGVVMYEMATGKAPFTGATAADIARAVVEGNPASPKAVNPAIDNGVLAILGGALFKDQFRRHKDTKALIEMIGKAAPEVVERGVEVAKRVAAPTAAPAGPATRKSILFIGDIANFDALDKAADPELASRMSAMMQQMFGEAVYLFNGEIVDSFGMPMIGEMPSINEALEAARKAEFDFSPDQQSGEVIQVRLLLHHGEVATQDGQVVGPGISKAKEILDQLPPLRLFLSEEFAKAAKSDVRLRDAGAKGGTKLYHIREPEPEPEATELDTNAQQAADAAEAIAVAVQHKQKKKRGFALAGAILGGVVAVGGGVGVMWMRQSSTPEPAVAMAPARMLPPTAANPRTIMIQPFAVEGSDPSLAAHGHAIRLATVEVLRSFPELRITDTADDGVAVFGARLRPGAAGTEIIPVATAGVKQTPGAAEPAADVASGVQAVVEYVAEQVRMQPRAVASADALNAFTLALTATDDNKVEEALRTATTADPAFLAAQTAAMRFFEKHNKPADALVAAKQVVVLDPSNLDAARKVARASLETGDLQQAFALYGTVLQKQRNDPEVLNHVARYTLATSDVPRFGQVLTRLKALSPKEIVAHEPDILVVNGRFEQAVDRYYDIEVDVPDNPALALKIGRLSVLRHAVRIAEIEVEKLQKNDPLYGYPLLKAYIAAENRNRGAAEAALKQAIAAAQPGDETWTCVAEVYAILADNNATVNALEKAAARKEPTAAYILKNPLFEYLSSDARFQKVRDSLTAQQQEIRAALRQVAL